ncbi:hypothetical protein [Sphingomonas sp.]|uniref:hypothetical protein n=1 Tax=Sphingomonas sp. TaxID=28214 RepID=UPI00286E37CF|nr:hypothetical protein [Sphingomonas sp.]
MKRSAALVVAIGATALSGCVAALAVSAADMAIRSAQGPVVSNEHLKPQAEAACGARAAPHGVVKVIDVEQRSVNKIVVWGTAGSGAERRSFECHYTTHITRFTLREIKPR